MQRSLGRDHGYWSASANAAWIRRILSPKNTFKPRKGRNVPIIY